MSINSALLAGVSGLVANSSALAAISDNIANVNTVAYKRNQVNFANVVTAQAVKGRYSAGGVQGITRQFVSTQGLIQSSGSATDLAISGDGFFVVTNKGAGLTASDTRSFTRQGSFSVDPAGFLRNDSGLFLQGWPVQSDGSFVTPPSDLTAMDSINVKNLGAAVSPTGKVGITANLDKVNPTAPDPIDVNIVDAAGGRHTLRLSFTQTSVNNWTMTPTTVPAADAASITPAAPIPVTFNTDGTINTVGGVAPDALALTVNWAATLGLPAQPITLDLTKVSQFDEPSNVGQISQDGAGAGNVVAIEVDEDGIVSAIYDNNQTRKVAKIAIATFPNADGLAQASGNSYRPTIDAGEMVLKNAGTGGAGLISPSSLEASTVDLSAEFTGLIQTQKAYSASSKIITTADQMLEELINIKR
ncbi:MAG: flagellar hook protein FlgE [Phenylobacterium sp.]|uniref:flagellar hook protein FlgE n=1 Tax=Phenylobacterium sp. TaxID=1871053 RepID=UPI0011FB3A91|nr:flagellar hook protein FlgE [Phenylobacterium sp.]TAJ69874.1 MAG: flagellar hook protein FlgE [Phenylobacterium sp.]